MVIENKEYEITENFYFKGFNKDILKIKLKE
jgi:hypothetical protein